jgi:hypothetical protein
VIELTVALAAAATVAGFALAYLVLAGRLRWPASLVAALALLSVSMMLMGALSAMPVKEVEVQAAPGRVERSWVYGDNPWARLFLAPIALSLATLAAAALLYLIGEAERAAALVLEEELP